jgi:hypothetical protein
MMAPMRAYTASEDMQHHGVIGEFTVWKPSKCCQNFETTGLAIVLANVWIWFVVAGLTSCDDAGRPYSPSLNSTFVNDTKANSGFGDANPFFLTVHVPWPAPKTQTRATVTSAASTGATHCTGVTRRCSFSVCLHGGFEASTTAIVLAEIY